MIKNRVRERAREKVCLREIIERDGEKERERERQRERELKRKRKNKRERKKLKINIKNIDFALCNILTFYLFHIF